MRVAAICCFTPLAQVYDEPFLVDTRMQMAAVKQWAQDNGAEADEQWVNNALETRHVPRLLGYGVDVAVAPTRQVLERAVADVDGFTAAMEAGGVRVVVLDAPVPEYTREMLANVYRRHSLPTSGYDGR